MCGSWRALLRRVALVAAVLTAAGCAHTAQRTTPSAPVPLGASALSHADLLWLERVGFGVDSAELADYRRLGRDGFLAQQLAARNDELPATITTQVDALQASQGDVVQTLAMVRGERRALRAVRDPVERQQAIRVLFQQGNQRAAAAADEELLKAIYDSAQLREQMVWFWTNHFSVSQNKADLRWLVGDYVEQAIRPHALGHFRDLVLATLESPAMLDFLDNAQNRAGHLNENYAREFMELHTLGVGAGYTQQDVQQLARVFTGVGIYTGTPPRLPPRLRGYYVQHGGFEFDPRRHDFSSKTLLGQRLYGRGFAEVENAVTLIVRQPACAHFISQELAAYFVADDPPPRLVAAMALTFQRTDGDIAAVLRTLFTSPEFSASLGGKFKDPMRYVVSTVRLAYDGQAIGNVRPVLGWLNALGEAPFGRQTPDGYPLDGRSWSSPGQMSRRFEIAGAIGVGRAPLGALAPALDGPLYLQVIEPFLATSTRAALDRARGPGEWNLFLLSSPELSYE